MLIANRLSNEFNFSRLEVETSDDEAFKDSVEDIDDQKTEEKKINVKSTTNASKRAASSDHLSPIERKERKKSKNEKLVKASIRK